MAKLARIAPEIPVSDLRGRCYVRSNDEFHLADFEEEWGRIAGKSGIGWEQESAWNQSKSVESILMHKSLRVGMRLVAAGIIVKCVIELFSPWGRAFTRFEWWIAVSLLVLPFYFWLELKRRAHNDGSKAILRTGVLLFILILPVIMSVVVIL